MSNTLEVTYQYRFYLDEQETAECKLWLSVNNIEWQRGMFAGMVYLKGTKNKHLGYFVIGDDAIYNKISSRWKIIPNN